MWRKLLILRDFTENPRRATLSGMSSDMDRRVVIPWWRRRRTLVAGAAAAVVLALGGLGVAVVGAAKSSVRVPAQNVTLGTVQRGVFHDFVVLRATAQPKDVIYLDALEGGQVREVFAQAGDLVKAGQPLLSFRNT